MLLLLLPLLLLVAGDALGQEVCSKPSAAGGCGSLLTKLDCAQYVGCAWSPDQASCINSPSCDDITCLLKDLGFRTFASSQPGCAQQDAGKCLAQQQRIFTGLGLVENCGKVMPQDPILPETPVPKPEEITEFLTVLYVSPLLGADSNAGTSREAPLRTPHRAVDMLRSLRKGLAEGRKRQPCKIVFMRGTHRFSTTLELGVEDSHITFEGMEGAVLSAARDVSQISWSRLSTTDSRIYVGDLSQLPAEELRRFAELSRVYVKDNAGVRARAPNVNDYLAHVRFSSASYIESWTHEKTGTIAPPVRTVRETVVADAQVNRYKIFNYGYDGACAGKFTPAVGYWCDPKADGDGLCPLSWPTGVYIDNQIGDFLNMRAWKYPSSSSASLYFHTLHPQKWGGWTFRVRNSNQSLPQEEEEEQTRAPSFATERPTNLESPPRDDHVSAHPTTTRAPSAAERTVAPTRMQTDRPTVRLPVITRYPTAPTRRGGNNPVKPSEDTYSPTALPTALPISDAPTSNAPTALPTSNAPTALPTSKAPTSNAPTSRPTSKAPTSIAPTVRPTRVPTMRPTSKAPTTRPTANPTLKPSTNAPTLQPSTLGPTPPTTFGPSQAPSRSPSLPTLYPTRRPTRSPTLPTAFPTPRPSKLPTSRPTKRSFSQQQQRRQLASKYLLQFESGGFQEARGDCTVGGGDFYLENAFELLDYYNEFFLDLRAKRLYYLPSAGKNFEAAGMELGSKLTVLVQAKGTSADPVRDLVFTNLVFEKTYPTHMHPHEMPSGGDVALHRGGALFLEGVLDVTVRDCTFRNLGSSGIFVSRFARQINILRNEFHKLESNAIFLVGDPKYESPKPWDRTADEDYVSDVVVRGNLASDLGIFEIQGCAVLISIAKNILVERNTFFNGPRGGVVLNDQFGGNIVLRSNFMFGFVQETLDHGPYNVWDRQSWKLPAGFVQPILIEKNFIIGTTTGEKLVDCDDGASRHIIRDNVLIDGYIKYKGYDHQSHGNIVIVGQQWGCLLMLATHRVPGNWIWRDNTCYARGMNPYAWRNADSKYCQKPNFDAHSNKYYGAVIDYKGADFKCASTKLSDWTVRYSQDKNSVWSGMPPAQDILQVCEDKVRTW